MSTGGSNAAFNVISGPLQGMQDSSQDRSMLHCMLDCTRQGYQGCSGGEELYTRAGRLTLPKSRSSQRCAGKKAAGTSGKVCWRREEKRSEIEREKKSEEELCLVAKRETRKGGEEDGR